MANLIRFIAQNEVDFVTDAPPVPAKSCIPQWFKDIPQERNYVDPRTGLRAVGRGKSTVKKCMPFLDAFNAGYMLCLPFDIGVELVDGVQHSYWKVDRPLGLDYELSPRTEGIPTPPGYGEQLWRIEIFPGVETPSGYSLLMTHPLNRYDLPFLTVSGVIDSDNYHGFLAATVHLRSDFSGVIPKGTPIAQVFPFKRENWKSTWEKPDVLKQKKEYFNLVSVINRSYQTNYWSRKKYE
jgi:hypothetical protein